MVQLTATVFFLALAATIFTTCYASIIPHSAKLHRRFVFVAHAPPRGWSNDLLEDYDQYHFRYLYLSCHQRKKADPEFFKSCCHPRLKSETINIIPEKCQLDNSTLKIANATILKSTANQGENSSEPGIPVYVNSSYVNSTSSNYSSASNSSSLVAGVTRNTLISTNQTLLVDPASAVPPNGAAKEFLDDASAKEAADEVASKEAADEEAAKKEADDAAAKKAADDAAAKKAADEAAEKKVRDDAAAKQDTKDTSSSYSSPSSGLLGGAVSQVFGQGGDAKGTFFYQGGAAGACGNVNSDSTPLVALPTDMYGSGQHCGKQVMIKNTSNGKTVVAKVQDMCPGCPTSTSLDLSTGAYDAIGDESSGVLPIEWGFM